MRARPPITDSLSAGPLLHLALSRPRETEVDETAERILRGALAQFEEFGVRRTTMDDVARRAGMSRITIYRRFSTKAALVEAVLLRECTQFFVALDAVVTELPTTEQRLVEGFAFALEFLRDHTLLNRLLDTEPASLLSHLTLEAAPILSAARMFLAERLLVEVAEGRLPPVDVEVAGELLTRLVLSFLLTPQSVVRLDTPDAARRFASRYLVPSLYATPPQHS